MKKFGVTTGKSANQKEWTVTNHYELDELDKLFQPGLQHKKDGDCFVPGVLVGSARKAKAVREVSMLVYDIDGGQTLDAVREKVSGLGTLAYIYTTYSHLSTRTKVKTDKFAAWAKKVGESSVPSAESLGRYLAAEGKGHLANIEFDPKGGKKYLDQDDEGMQYICYHDPVEKFRVALPLEEPIVLADLSPLSSKQLEVYKSIYHGVGQALGLIYDHKCEDPSRLFYMPRYAEGVTAIVEKYDGVLFDHRGYPRLQVAPRDTRTAPDGSKRPLTPGDYIVLDRDGATINLLAWQKNNYDFDIEELLSGCLPDEMQKAARPSGGFHVECPFESQHTNAGGLGTFCANGDGDRAWTIYCSHNACKDRNKLDYLKEYISLGYITAADLGITAPAAPAPDRDMLAKALGVDPSTLPLMDSPEEEEAFDSVIPAVTRADEILSTEEVYEAALEQLSTSSTLKEARSAVSRMKAKGCEISTEDIAEVVAKSPLRGEHARTLFTGMAQSSVIALNYDLAVAVFGMVRAESNPLKEKVRELYEERLTGIELHVAKKQLTEYYLCDPGIVDGAYHSYEMELVQQEQGSVMAKHMESLTQTWAKLKMGSSVKMLNMPASREKGDAVTLNPPDLATMYRNKNVTFIQGSGKGAKAITKFAVQEWMQQVTGIKEFEEYTFEPGKPPEFDKKFNLWDQDNGNGGFPIRAVEGDCSIVLNHIRDVWCNGDDKAYNWVITWLAQIFQQPGVKYPTSIALLGPQGTGKSVIFEHGLSKMLGPFFGASASREDVVGRWSRHLSTKLLWLSEETLFSGDKVGANKLKDRISSNRLAVEPKGVDLFMMKNFTRYVFTSNQLHALHTDADDRRFTVLATTTVHAQDVNYFTKMREWFEKGGAEHFLHYLLNWKPEEHGLTWSSLNTPYNTEAKRQQAEMSVEDQDNFFLEFLKYGRITDAPNSVFMDGRVSWPLNEGVFVSIPRLRAMFESYLKYHMGTTARFERNKFSSLVGKYFGVGQGGLDAITSVRKIDGKTVRGYELPAREKVLSAAVSSKILSPQQRQDALDSPNSHVYTETSDVF